MSLTTAEAFRDLLAKVEIYIKENYEQQAQADTDADVAVNALIVREETKPLDVQPYTLPDFENIGESFQEALFRMINERNLKETDVYKDANMDRKLFSKIRSNKQYQPKKSTAVALAIALKLGLEETESFIKTAGFAFSNSNKFDLIIKYFINQKEYNIIKINQVLFMYDQVLL